jgi:hypothetical protein
MSKEKDSTGGVSRIYSDNDTKEILTRMTNTHQQKKQSDENLVEPYTKCPICNTINPIMDTSEIRCNTCQCILSNNYPYTAGLLHDLPWGIRL